MPLKQVCIKGFQKFVYGWLILCVGGVGSLPYFDGFLPGHEHGQHPVHLSILEWPTHQPDDPLSHLREPKVLAEQMHLWLVRRVLPHLDFIIAQQHHAPGLAQFFTSGLNKGYDLTIARVQLFNDPTFFGSVALQVLTGRSAFLSPPDKPPPPNLA
jgi:hypothetical protein